MKRLRKNLLPLAFSLLLTAGLLEGGAWILLRTGAVRRNPQQLDTEYLGRVVPDHPYVGSRLYGVNRPREYDDLAIPTQSEKAGRRHVVITGGSVAHQLHRGKREFLLREFTKLWGPTSLSIIAAGGMKQPQHVSALLYSLSIGRNPDVIISLDGYNEGVLPLLENVPSGVQLAYPRNWAIDNIRTSPAYLRLAGRVASILGTRDRAHRATRVLPPQTAKLLTIVVDNRVDAVYRDLEKATAATVAEANTAERRDKALESEDSKAVLEESVDIWIRASHFMKLLADVHGIRYYLFLQPNQYVAGSKPFTVNETNIFLSAGEKGTIARMVYPMLMARGEVLRKEGMPFHDLTDVFRAVKGDLYVDDCCHVNEDGNQILAERIISIVRADFMSGRTTSSAR